MKTKSAVRSVFPEIEKLPNGRYAVTRCDRTYGTYPSLGQAAYRLRHIIYSEKPPRKK